MINIGNDINRINSEYYSEHLTNKIKIIETKKDGKAELELVFPISPKTVYYKLEKEQERWLNFGVNKQCADGIIIAVDDNFKAKIFIVELKNSIGATKWSEILGQFRGSILRGITFCNTLGINDILEVNFYTGCENYKKIEEEQYTRSLQQQNLSGPVSRKTKVGLNMADIDQWGQAMIKPFNNSQYFKHQIIQLTKKNGINLGVYII